MKWITEHFVNRALKKKRSRRNDKPVFNQGIKSIGIIAPSQQELKETIAVIKSNFDQTIQVSGIFYSETTQEEDAFSYRDFSLFGQPKEKITKFLSTKPEVMIATSGKLNSFSLYVLYLNPEPYSLGFYSENIKEYLDLMLTHESAETTENMEHLMKYLKQVI